MKTNKNPYDSKVKLEKSKNKKNSNSEMYKKSDGDQFGLKGKNDVIFSVGNTKNTNRQRLLLLDGKIYDTKGKANKSVVLKSKPMKKFDGLTIESDAKPSDKFFI